MFILYPHQIEKNRSCGRGVVKWDAKVHRKYGGVQFCFFHPISRILHYYYYYYYYYYCELLTSTSAEDIHRSSSDSKSPQVSWTLLSIIAYLSNVIVWIDPFHPPVSISSSPRTKLLRISPSAPITIAITVTLILHSFLSSLS